MNYGTNNDLYTAFRDYESFSKNKPCGLHIEELRQNYLNTLDTKRVLAYESIADDLNIVVKRAVKFYKNFHIDSSFKFKVREALIDYTNQLIIDRWLISCEIKIFTAFEFVDNGIIFYTEDKEEYFIETDICKLAYAESILFYGLYKVDTINPFNNLTYYIKS